MPAPKRPAITKELVEWLEYAYPDRCPTIDMDDRAVWMAAGQAKLVRGLRAWFDEQARASLMASSTTS